MIPLLAIGLPVVVALLFWWMSAATDRRNQRSMQRYGSALDVLGDVSRRSEASAPVPFPAPDETARPHIGFDPVSPGPEERSDRDDSRPPLPSLPPQSLTGELQRLPLFDDLQPQREPEEGFLDASATAAALGRMVARSRFNREYGISSEDVLAAGSESRVHLTVPSGELLQFGTDEIISIDDEPEATTEEYRGRPFSSLGRRRRDLRVGPPRGTRRRRQLVLIAAVALLAIGGSLFATLGRSPTHVAGKPPSVPSQTRPSGDTKPKTVPSVPPKILVPTTTTKALVTYQVPTSRYTLVFSSTGACWLGAERTVNGAYLWMSTLSAGATTSYRASGTRVIRIGAPRKVSIMLDGIPVALPKFVVPYDIKLVVRTS